MNQCGVYGEQAIVPAGGDGEASGQPLLGAGGGDVDAVLNGLWCTDRPGKARSWRRGAMNAFGSPRPGRVQLIEAVEEVRGQMGTATQR